MGGRGEITYHRSKKKIFKTYAPDWAEEEKNVAIAAIIFLSIVGGILLLIFVGSILVYIWGQLCQKTQVEDEETGEAESRVMIRDINI